MKKLLALVLALALTFSLVACGGKEGGTPEGGDAEGQALKVCLIVTQLGDKSFNDSAYEGLKKAEKELGIELKIMEITTDISKIAPAYTEAAEAGYDVITSNQMGFGETTVWLEQNAANYPDTTFLIYDEYTNIVDAENVTRLCFKQNESDFLAGALAAKLSKTGTIGFVGGMDVPVIADFLVGYIQGAKYANPDVKMVLSYAESWTDPAKGKELGLAAINTGADVIHAVAGGSGNGALEAAFDKGVMGIGVDADQYALYKDSKPELAKSIITSSLKNVGSTLEICLKGMIDGTFAGGSEMWFGMEDGACGLAENENYQANVPEDVKAYMEEVKAKLASGEIKVDSYFGMDEATYKAFKDSVK